MAHGSFPVTQLSGDCVDCDDGGEAYLWYTVYMRFKFLRRFKKILVVEDDRALRQALVEKLRYEGFSVVAVE